MTNLAFGKTAKNHPRLLRHVPGTLTALDQNQPHKHAANFALTHFASGAVYSFIPKNACSTMRVSLAIANGCIAGPEDFAWIHNNNGTFRADLQALATASYTFAILRCPYRRLASTFFDKIVGRTPEFWGLHRAHGDQLDPDNLTFRAFVEAIKLPGFFKLNIHWRPQVDFLVYETYDDLFRMEDFTAVAPRLRDRIGLDIVDARPLTAHGTDGLTRVDGDYADIPTHILLEMRRRGEIPAYEALYDPDIVSKVAKLYKKDLNFYTIHFGAAQLLFEHKI